MRYDFLMFIHSIAVLSIRPCKSTKIIGKASVFIQKKDVYLSKRLLLCQQTLQFLGRKAQLELSSDSNRDATRLL